MSLALIIIILAVLVASFLLFGMLFGSQTTTRILPEQMDWDALADSDLQASLPNRKINAIKRYRELTGAGLREAKDTIDYVIANPDALSKRKSGMAGLAAEGGAGLRDLIAEDRLDEAVRVYAQFMGVDQFTAKESVARIRQAMVAEGRLSDDMMRRVQRLVDDGDTAEALVEYQRLTGADLNTAEAVIDLLRQ